MVTTEGSIALAAAEMVPSSTGVFAAGWVVTPIGEPALPVVPPPPR